MIVSSGVAAVQQNLGGPIRSRALPALLSLRQFTCPLALTRTNTWITRYLYCTITQEVIRAAVIHELQSPADEVRRRGDSE